MEAFESGRVLEASIVSALAQEGLVTVRLRRLSGGIVNINYQADCLDGKSVLFRIYSSDRMPNEISFQEKALTALSRRGCLVQIPIAGGVLESGARYGIYTFIRGEPASRLPMSSHLVGQVASEIARVHRAGADLSLKIDAPTGGVEYIGMLLKRTMADRRELAGDEGWRHALGAFDRWGGIDLEAGFSTGIVHGDLYDENVIVSDGELAGIVDFDDCFWGCQMHDVATGAMEFAWRDVDVIDWSYVDAFLDAYLGSGGRLPGRVDLLRFMLVNCVRFLAYTVDLFPSIALNPYASRIRWVESRLSN